MSNGLRITVPVTMTDAVVTATDVPEADYAAWSSGTTYALADRTIKNHVIWQSIQAGNTNHDPTESGSAWWKKVSATNRWCLFDLNQVTSTAQADSMYYELQPGAPVTSLHVLGLSAVTSVRVRVYDMNASGALVYDGGLRSAGLLPDRPDWWHYFFGPWTIAEEQHYADLPYISNPKIRVDFAGDPDMSVQVLMIGNDSIFADSRGFGVVRDVGIRVDRITAAGLNAFDIPTLTVGTAISTVNFDLIVPSREVDQFMRWYRANGRKSCLFTISDQWSSTQLIGTITVFKAVINGPTQSTFSVEIQGVPQQ